MASFYWIEYKQQISVKKILIFIDFQTQITVCTHPHLTLLNLNSSLKKLLFFMLLVKMNWTKLLLIVPSSCFNSTKV